MYVATRTNAQTSRPGWRPRKRSLEALARDIAHSITQSGGTRQVEQYTSDPVLMEKVRQALAQ